MSRAEASFDIALAYPQWQGSGRAQNLRRGAAAAAAVCARFAPLHEVPALEDGEAQGGVNRWTAIYRQFRCAQEILRNIRPSRVLTAGGDCAVDIAVIDYLASRYPDLIVVWVDAHLDANTPETSPSGDFHGMPVAAILGSPPPALRPFLGQPLHPSQFKYYAAAVGDRGDWDFQAAAGLAWLTPDDVLSGPVHIHFDLDVLDPLAFPYLAYKDGSLAPRDGIDLVRRIAAGGKLVGLTITEFAPADERGAENGSHYIQRLCEAAGAALPDPRPKPGKGPRRPSGRWAARRPYEG